MSAQVIATPFGRFLVDETDIIESTLKAGTLWDGPGFLQPIALEYGELGTPGVTILDVGANVGSFSIWCASRGAWRVLAVEPVQSTYTRLLANLDLNREPCADRVIPLRVAAYDQAGTLWHEAPDPGNVGGLSLLPAHSTNPFSVPCAPLDAYRWLMGDRVSLIKLDIQGCEGRALRGLEVTLIRDRPTLVFEWDDTLAKAHGMTEGDTRLFLASLDYDWHPWPSHPDNVLARPRHRQKETIR